MEHKLINVLVSLYKGYGLGDAVRASIILQHLRKYRPHWIIDFQAEEGRHQVGRGISRNTFAYGQPYPSAHYDAEEQIIFYDNWSNWYDRPNTCTSQCLKDRFNLDWDANCGRYKVNVSGQVKEWARHRIMKRTVGLHFKGVSAPDKKNLSGDKPSQVCDIVSSHGRKLLYLGMATEGGHDIEMMCALIQRCDAFIGIDSGPGKCASATNTPTLIVWTGHHPAQFHDPAPNTTHLVPYGYHSMRPVCGDNKVIRWFEDHYTVMIYYNNDPIPQISKWLREVLK